MRGSWWVIIWDRLCFLALQADFYRWWRTCIYCSKWYKQKLSRHPLWPGRLCFRLKTEMRLGRSWASAVYRLGLQYTPEALQSGAIEEAIQYSHENESGCAESFGGK
jgi:hypothetical protein